MTPGDLVYCRPNPFVEDEHEGLAIFVRVTDPEPSGGDRLIFLSSGHKVVVTRTRLMPFESDADVEQVRRLRELYAKSGT